MRPFFLAACLFLAACGSDATTVDGSSKEAAEQSIASLSGRLTDDGRAQFAAAIEMGWSLSEIAGKTPDEVIALARARKVAELRETTLPALEARVAEAATAVEEAAKHQKASARFLRGITLLKPEYMWRQMEDGSSSPLLTFSMRNDTSEAIQTIVFQATIGPKGAGQSWIDQRFEFRFVEAVTSGEEKFVFVAPDLTLAGNAIALESKNKSSSEIKFGIDFIRVADLNGRVIMDDEGVAKAEAALQATRDAVSTAKAELARLEGGGSIAT